MLERWSIVKNIGIKKSYFSFSARPKEKKIPTKEELFYFIPNRTNKL